MQNVTFGMLTASAHMFSFEELDVDGDGIITTIEINSLLKEKNMDILDLSSMDKDADKKVTKEEYILWEQESRMSEAVTNAKNNIARDFVGYNRNDILDAIKKLDEYQKDFITNFTTRGQDITRMAEIFCKNLPFKYREIKNDILINSDTSIKNKVIKSIIQDIQNNNANSVTENSMRILGDLLNEEADKFINVYSGGTLEDDLFHHLQTLLAQTDKSKLSGAVETWDNDSKDLESLPKELALIKAKNNAKSFLLRALKEGINTIKLGNVTIRTEVEIVPVLAQYRNYESLINDLNKAICQLSGISLVEQVLKSSDEKDDDLIEDDYIDKVKAA